jgi:tRNA(Ile)-lysidine synthase
VEGRLATERRRLVQPLVTALDEHLGGRVVYGLLLAVSGGPDSRALLEATARWPARFLGAIHVVSVDHGTRPSSAGEALSVVARAGVLGFEGSVARLLGAGGGERADEASLRDARYRALSERAHLHGLATIVVAHHQSDVAEGALLSWLGGGGPGASMARVRRIGTIDIVRPFLTLARATLRQALTGVGAADVIVDPERRSRRAEVREEELGRLGGRRRQVEEHLARAAQRRRDDEDLLAVGAAALLQPAPHGLRVARGPPALVRRALRLALSELLSGVDGRDSSAALDAIVELMRCGKTGVIHLRGAHAHVGELGVDVWRVGRVAAEPRATHDVTGRLSKGGPMVTL